MRLWLFPLCRDVAPENELALLCYIPIMARKKKRDDLNPQPFPASGTSDSIDAGRQPRLLGWIVLILGSFSTWYWYRPLPSSVAETLHSTPKGPTSIWANGRFDLPSLETLVEEDSQQPHSRTQTETTPELLGKPGVALLPQIDPLPNVRDVLNKTSVPLLPPVPPIQVSSQSRPETWSPEQQSPVLSRPLLKAGDAWPDIGYVPESHTNRGLSQNKMEIPPMTTSHIPPLLETGMRTIRLADEAEKSEGLPARPTTKATNDAPPRQPQFIRQPARKP